MRNHRTPSGSTVNASRRQAGLAEVAVRDRVAAEDDVAVVVDVRPRLTGSGVPS